MTTYGSSAAGPGRSGGRQSLIDRESHFNGSYATPNDLRVEGQFEGEIECKGTLVVAETAAINARVTAGSITVAGRLQGEIGCRGRFEILPSGRVGAQVIAGSIVVHEGAQYEGELRMRTAEQADASRGGGQRTANVPGQRRPTTSEALEPPTYPASTARANGRAQADEGVSYPSGTVGREGNTNQG